MLLECEANAAPGGELPRISQEVTERFYNLSPVAHSVRCPSWVDTVEKGILRGSLSNIDSRRASNEQHRFKNPFARIRLFQLLIPQLHFGYFFNSIGQPRPKHLGRWANHVRNALRAYTISDAAPGDGRNTNGLRCSPSRQPRAHRVNRVNLLLDRLRLAAPRAAAPRIAFHCREGPANPAGTKQ